MKQLIKQISILLFFYIGLRFGFFFYHYSEYKNYSFAQIIYSLLFGLRYDFATIALLNAPFFLLQTAFPGKLRTFLLPLLVFLNSAFLFLNLFDIEFYNFSGQRLSYSNLTALGRDIAQQGLGVVRYYWAYSFFVLLLLGMFATAQIWAWDKRVQKQSMKRRVFGTLLLTLVLGMGVRGGIQRKPLSPTHALLAGDKALATLALNSSYSFLRSFNDAQLPRKEYFATHEEAQHLLQQPPSSIDASLRLPEKTNVVLLVLESFSLEYMGREAGAVSYTPFLNRLAAKGVFFPKHFANGRTSIEALPALLAQIPSLIGQSFITSPYTKTKLTPIPQVLKEAGYESAFFHGGYTGTMYFDALAKLFSFDRYYGAEDFPGFSSGQDEDGQWGVVDEPYLLFAATELTKFNKPFFATVFTLSSHHPYKIPKIYEGRFPKGTLEIHEAIGYADYALSQFFARAEKEPWFANTLFVVTADHTSKSEDPRFSSNIWRYRVPLLFWHPNHNLSVLNPNLLSSHVDVAPTIFALLGLTPKKINLFGSSLAGNSKKRSVVLRIGDAFTLLENENALELQGDESERFFRWEDGVSLQLQGLNQEKLSQQLSAELKAHLQYFFNGLLDDRLLVVLD